MTQKCYLSLLSLVLFFCRPVVERAAATLCVDPLANRNWGFPGLLDMELIFFAAATCQSQHWFYAAATCCNCTGPSARVALQGTHSLDTFVWIHLYVAYCTQRSAALCDVSELLVRSTVVAVKSLLMKARTWSREMA